MLNGAVKGEEEKASLDGAGSPPCNCFRITADCNYSCCGGEEGERVGRWVEERAARGRRDLHPCPVSLPLDHPGACRLVCGDLCSSPRLGVDGWHLGFPLVPIPIVPRNADYCEQCLRMHKLTTGIQPQILISCFYLCSTNPASNGRQLKWASTGPAELCTLNTLLDWFWVCFTLEGSTVRASQFMDFSVWGLVQWNSVQVCLPRLLYVRLIP